MTLDQLRIFIAVAELEHMTKAARKLNLTQSAASSAIAALESRYATRLFDRVGRSIALTPEGRIFLQEAQAVVARARAAELVLADLAGLKVGSLSVAASQTVGNYWLPQAIHRFHALYPGISVNLTIGNTSKVAAQVLDGEANIGFIEGEVSDDLLTVDIVAEDEMVLVVAPGHPWAALPAGEKPDFHTANWVIREPGSGTRAILANMLSAFGIDLDKASGTLTLPSNEAVRAAVESGAGPAVLSRHIVDQSVSLNRLKALDIVTLPTRRFSMLRHRNRYHTAVATEFVDLIMSGQLSTAR